MFENWALPDQVFDGKQLVGNIGLRIEDGRVAETAPADRIPDTAKRIKGIVSPGFVDLQVNGGGGVLLNQTPTAQAMLKIAAAHRKFGTTSILPTVITDTPEVLSAAVDAAIASRNKRCVLGLHIEGPHISSTRRGTHSASYIRPMDEVTISQVRLLRDVGVSVMITLAPEAATIAQVAELAATGAVVSIGHSDATAKETRYLIAAGARSATHLFNAMPPMLNREPGVVGAVINSSIYAGLIVDGIHVADDMISLAIRARPEPERMFIVSDAMPTVGGPETFELYGQQVGLKKGRLINAEGSLAGAHLTQADGVWRLSNVLGLKPEDALRMAISVPAELIGRTDLANIESHRVEDLICLSPDLKFKGYLGGKVLEPAPS